MSVWSISSLLLPLLGGFLFCIVYPRLRFLLGGDSGQRLLLASASSGIVFVLLGHILLNPQAHIPIVPDSWLPLLPLPSGAGKPFPAAELFALVAGPIVGSVAAFCDNRQSALSAALISRGDRLGYLLDRAYANRRPVMLTLRSGKVYVGLVKHTMVTYGGPSYLELLPAYSGYREPVDAVAIRDDDRDPKRVHFNVMYREILDWLPDAYDATDGTALPEDGLLEVKADGHSFKIDATFIGIVIPFDDVELATLFDIRLYAYFNRRHNPKLWDAIKRG